MMQGSIVTRPQMTIIGVVWTGPFERAAEVGQLWKRFMSTAPTIDGRLNPTEYISPCHDRTTDFTCYIGVEVEPETPTPQECTRLVVPEQIYACFQHKGSMSQVESTYNQAFTWMKENGYSKNLSRFTLEVYRDESYNPTIHDANRAENSYDIYIPIQSM